MTTTETGADWLDSVTHAAEELAQVALGFMGVELLGPPDELPKGMYGSYIQLVGESSVHIGLCAEEDECVHLSKALLGMEDGEDITREEIADAMGEIVNIIAGSVKTRMVDRVGELTIGLPVHFFGHIQCSDHQELSVEVIRLGEIDAVIIALCERES